MKVVIDLNVSELQNLIRAVSAYDFALYNQAKELNGNSLSRIESERRREGNGSTDYGERGLCVGH